MAISASFRQDLCDIPILEDAGSLRMKSRDFFWFSPILKETLDDKRADIVVVPRDKADVMRLAAACARNRVPLTVRGGGTGNYGQAVPLAGGVVLDMTRLDQLIWHRSRPPHTSCASTRPRASTRPSAASSPAARPAPAPAPGDRSPIPAPSLRSKSSPLRSIPASSSCAGATFSR